MLNPYKNVNWSSYQQVVSTSHAHCKRQATFDALYNGGVRFFVVSNYYASQPLYPSDNGVISDIPSLREDIVVPNDCIVSANAEHHNFGGMPAVHLNSLGSTFSSGSPEYYDESTGTWKRDAEPVGMNGASVKKLIESVKKTLIYPDGGGITINHPIWTHGGNAAFTPNAICKLLDMSPLILGQEVIEDGNWENDARPYWDAVLMTGRRSWGFFVPDHAAEPQKFPNSWIGRNVLLVPTFTERECLKAYRNGAFYGRKGWSNLAFTQISVSGKKITVKTNSAERIFFIVDGARTEKSGSSASFTCPATSTYVRVEAEGLDDIIFSQPVIFRVKTTKSFSKAAMFLWGRQF